MRKIAVNVEDVKHEQRDQRMLLGRKVEGNNSNENPRHPVFEQHLTMPLTTVEEFKSFEKKLLEPEIRNNLVSRNIVTLRK